MRTAVITIIAAAALAAPAAASSPALTKHEALVAIGATAPAALGLPDADRVQYARLRLRGHHARVIVDVIKDGANGRGDSATGVAFVVKNSYGTIRVHYRDRLLELGLRPDPAP